MPGFSNLSGSESIMFADNASFDGTERDGALSQDGELWIGSSDVSQHVKKGFITGSGGITITNGDGTINIAGTGPSTDLHLPRFIVGPTTTHGAAYTSIASAIIDAVSAQTSDGINQTVGIQPGTYTENITWPQGINLFSMTSDALTPNVTIVGKLTCTDAGARSASGIRFKTNGDFFLAVTGTLATYVYLKDCFLDVNNNTGITYTSSSASSGIEIITSDGNIATTGITYFSSSGAGTVRISRSVLLNTGSSTTASTFSAGTLQITNSRCVFPITTSGTNTFTASNSNIQTGTATTALTCGGSGANQATHTNFNGTTASDVSIGSNLTLAECTFNSSNTNAITGAGTVSYGGLVFLGSSSKINTTTQTLLYQDQSSKFGSSNGGNTNTLTVTNDSNTASSAANIVTSVAGSTAADAFYTAQISGGQAWSWGVDNSTSGDNFKISASTALGTSDILNADNAGNMQITNTGTAASLRFSVYNSDSDSASTAALFTATTGADAYYRTGSAAGRCYAFGVDWDDSTSLKLTTSAAFDATPSSASVILKSTSAGAVSFTLGNVDVTRSNSGADVSHTISNSSNTASSTATNYLTVAGTSAGDARTQYAVSGTTTWTEGIDNSDSDAYVLAASSALGTTNVLRASTAGEINYPLQPCFFAYVTTTINNVTGDGTVYTVIFDTEAYDQGNNFNLGTSTFTAPVTGRYLFEFTCSVGGGTTITPAVIKITTTGLTVEKNMQLNAALSTTTVNSNMAVIINMTAGNTAIFTVTTTDSGGKIDDVLGLNSGSARTYVSGHLVA